jgi:hypothetical protein
MYSKLQICKPLLKYKGRTYSNFGFAGRTVYTCLSVAHLEILFELKGLTKVCFVTPYMCCHGGVLVICHQILMCRVSIKLENLYFDLMFKCNVPHLNTLLLGWHQKQQFKPKYSVWIMYIFLSLNGCYCSWHVGWILAAAWRNMFRSQNNKHGQFVVTCALKYSMYAQQYYHHFCSLLF